MYLSDLIRSFEEAATKSRFQLDVFGQIGQWPLLALSRASAAPHGKCLYLSAGIHGDEPAGPIALLELIQDDAFPQGNSYWICPLLNPSGLAVGTRENTDGIDLNRDYSNSQSPEVRSHLIWLQQTIGSLDLCMHLHEDWEGQGFYLYELNFSKQAGLAEDLLAAARQHLPIEPGSEIDGHPATSGIIRPETMPEVEDGDPEAIYCCKTFGGLNYTLETPSAQPMKKRVAAHKAAVLAALSA